MFGYVIANAAKLDDTQRERYRAWYCGLCKALGDRHGFTARLTLTYDMTFLVILLSSLYRTESQCGRERCAVHPFKRHGYIINGITEYAADMNLLLSWYSLDDDWRDDRNVISLTEAKLLGKACGRIEIEYPRQAKTIKGCLEQLSRCEKSVVINPDIPANLFGRLMAEIFVMSEDEHSDELRRFGRALGRVIYIMDACVDFDSDVSRLRYNPMVSVTKSRFEPILSLLVSECTDIFERLPIETDKEIMENILFSGIWAKYSMKYNKDKKEEAGRDEGSL